MKYANDDTFNDVIKSDKLTIIDFYATWCMPCTMQSEVLEKLEKSRLDCDIIKINVDEAPNASNEFEITSIPTLIFMKSGKILKKNVGFCDEQELLNMIEEVK